MKVSIARSTVIVAVSAVLGLGVGGGVVAFAADSDSSTPSAQSPGTAGDDSAGTGGPGRSAKFAKVNDIVTEKPWPKNEFGLTFGEPTNGDVEAGNLPDLMTTFVDETGETGYYLSKEVYPAPDDLAEQTRLLLNDRGEDIQTIYAADGKTVLGKRIVSVTTGSNEKGETVHPVTGRVIEPK